MFFSAEKLTSVWKDLLKEYKTVLVNFTKSGNHESSFMKAKQVTPVPLHLIQNLTGDDLSDGNDDEFGMETGG
jgi:hypothetical protein